MELFSGYETPLWTLIGVIMGYLLSYVQSWRSERKQYKTKVQETIERIKKSLHISDSQYTIQRIADLIPQFKEKEQIEILSKIGFESSLNAKTDNVTKCVIEEFRWIGILYEVPDGNQFVKKSRTDEKKVKSLQSALWEILFNIVEYRKSEELFRSAFRLLDTINHYSITQGYEDVIYTSIEISKSISKHSKNHGFQFGLEQSIQQFTAIKQLLSQSKLKSPKLSKFLSTSKNVLQSVEENKHDGVITKMDT